MVGVYVGSTVTVHSHPQFTCVMNTTVTVHTMVQIMCT